MGWGGGQERATRTHIYNRPMDLSLSHGYLVFIGYGTLPTVSDMFFLRHTFPWSLVGGQLPSTAGYGLRSRTLSSLGHQRVGPGKGIVETENQGVMGKMISWLVATQIFFVHPEPWGNDPI